MGAMTTMDTNSTNSTEISDVAGNVVTYMLATFSILGTIGNSVVLYVFSIKTDKLTSRCFIIALAFNDFVTCLVIIPFTAYMDHAGYQIHIDFLCKFYSFMITSNVPFSAFIMVAIAFDRYFCICHPFLHLINIKRAKIIIATLALGAIILGINTAVAYGIFEKKTINATTGLLSNDTSLHHLWNSTWNASHEMLNFTGVKLNLPGGTRIINTGVCKPNTLIVSEQSRLLYQKVYAGSFLLSLLLVAILYMLIYKSVIVRRRKSIRRKVTRLPSESVNETQTTVLNGNNVIYKNEEARISSGKGKKNRHKNSVKGQQREFRMANIKTAAILFVVTLVFSVAFLPSWLMAHKLISFNAIVFYMYFIYNVANPVIYAFMNKIFRNDLKRIVNCLNVRP